MQWCKQLGNVPGSLYYASAVQPALVTSLFLAPIQGAGADL